MKTTEPRYEVDGGLGGLKKSLKTTKAHITNGLLHILSRIKNIIEGYPSWLKST